MRLLTFRDNGSTRSAVEIDGWVVDSAQLGLAACETNRELLEDGPERLAELSRRAAEAAATHAPAVIGSAGELELGPPIVDPDKIICVGLNYRDHVQESGREIHEHPTLFAKFRNSLVGPRDPVLLPDASTQIDYEGELAVVIGRAGSGIAAADALSYVAGAMVVNDVTARDMQYRTTQWLHGKAIDTFAPCGPALVTLDEIGDLGALHLRTRVNGTVVQDARTSAMLFPVVELVASISEAMTLVPGDIICTGTPGGVGSKRNPPVWLTAGDVVQVDIGGIGALRNTFVPASERN